MDLGIAGRKAIVCASSRGLGKGCAFALARNGVHVTLNGRDEQALNGTAEEIAKATGVQVKAVLADIGSPEGQAKVLAACPDPDILVNNNGGPPFRDFRQVDRKALLEGVIMNMATPIELIQQVIDKMIERRFGRVVNITSISVRMPVVGLDLSSGARAGLTAFLSGVARTVAQHNVTINNILPGFFETDRLRTGMSATAKMQNRSVNEVADERANSVPARRFGSPHEFGETCAFLCSQQAGYITGQNILLDGGLFASAF
ncbi:MAG: SDR family oxidoreductase [Alphaproteobacteria bacterium]|nr:SDR family oxidoreductase [Alphaproteobacteria bacterium]